MMPTQLIINADDFGACRAVNEAVIRSHREGVLTSAGLMVGAEGSIEAAAMARENPELAVGLHIVLDTGDPVLAAIGYYFHPTARRRIRRVIGSQFDAFAETGLLLSHVDGHHHLHAHPAVLPVILDLAPKYGACGIRVPREPFWESVRVDHGRLGAKVVTAVGHAYLASVCRRLLRDSDLATCDLCIGAQMSGRMTDDYVIRILQGVECESIEVFFHPACADHPPRPFGPNEGDLNALLSPRLKRFLQEGGWELTNYAGLRRRKEARDG